MSLLRILRNLAVLVILTVSGLSLVPRAMTVQPPCRPPGAVCQSQAQCCPYLACSQTTHRCCIWYRQACTSNSQCCGNDCNSVYHRCGS
jgi:hypothetical protein